MWRAFIDAGALIKAVLGNTNEPTKYVPAANDKTMRRSSLLQYYYNVILRKYISNTQALPAWAQIGKQWPWNIESCIVLGHALFAQGEERGGWDGWMDIVIIRIITLHRAPGEENGMDGYSCYQDTCTCVTPTSRSTHESAGGNGRI